MGRDALVTIKTPPTIIIMPMTWYFVILSLSRNAAKQSVKSGAVYVRAVTRNAGFNLIEHISYECCENS